MLLVPIFLFAAGHLKRDIPHELASAQGLLDGVAVRMTPPLGHQDALLDVAYERLEQTGFTRHASGTVVFVGRGSRDEQAQAMFETIARRAQERYGIRRLETAYLAGTGVMLETVLARVVADGERSIWVWPYLWFQGYLTRTLPERVERGLAQAGVAETSVQTRISRPLGVHPGVVELVGEMVAEQLAEWR
ncbi:hypothetical protein GCM10025857_19960 [Alicyclobacillus contaminans]|nr:hypothetical protein GCM10025857_19960 [Alicyclobacillus contaminans]